MCGHNFPQELSLYQWNTSDLFGLSDAELDELIADTERIKAEETLAEDRRQKEAKLKEIQLELAGMRVSAKRLTLEATISQAAMC